MRTVGGLYRRKGSKVWNIQFIHAGRRYRESSGTTDRKVATALLKKRITEIIEGRVLPRSDRVTFDDLATLIEADYVANERRSLASLQYRLTRLKAGFGKSRPGDIVYTDLVKYVTKRTAEGASAATVRYEIVVLGRMFKLAVRAGLLKTIPPLPTIELRNARQGFFEADELAKVLAALPADVAPAIEFASITGFRIGEVRALKWSQIDGNASVIRLEAAQSKTAEGRTWPFGLHPRLAALMGEQVDRTMEMQRNTGRIVPWVFWWGNGVQLGDFRKHWRRACKTAKCPGRRVHDLRRGAVRNLLRSGVTEHVAMILTGHKTRSILDRYDIVSERDLRNAVGKLARRQG
jgi:integrase